MFVNKTGYPCTFGGKVYGYFCVWTLDKIYIKYYIVLRITKYFEMERTMQDKYERQMKKGVLDMLVLRLLSDEEKYGYQLISELQEKSHGVFVLKEGTLYPVLYRLEEEGQIEGKWSQPEGKQVPRKYYMITEKGRQDLEKIRDIWQQISGGIMCIMEEV